MSDDRAFRVLVTYDHEQNSFLARVPELDLSVHAASRTEAVTEAEHAIEQRIAAAVEDKEPLPEPTDMRAVDGTLTLKIADAIHREILFYAAASEMTPEDFASQLLARATGALDGVRPGRKRAPPPGPRTGHGGEDEDVDPRSTGDRAAPREDRDGREVRGYRGGRGARPREGYRPDLDDKANFLEYLRGLDKGGGNQGGGRGRR